MTAFEIQDNDYNHKVEEEFLADWENQPDRTAAYIDRDNLTTWLGTVIGKVIWSQRTNTGFGKGLVTDYRIRGNNGAMYFGRMGDNRTAINLRKSRK